MSRTNPDAMERLALLDRCDYCDAAAGDWCVTSSGAWAVWLHGFRAYVAQQARSLGYAEGMASAYRGIRSEVEWRQNLTSSMWPPPNTLDELLEHTDELAATWERHAAHHEARL